MGPSVQEMFNAILIEDVDGKPKAGLTRMSTEQLPAEAVLVRVSHSALNYKDGLAVSARGRIARSLPMVAGIDLAGTVEESSCPAWKKGDRVLVNGFGLSERYWGGYSQFARMKSEWLVRIPDELTAEEVMAFW